MLTEFGKKLKKYRLNNDILLKDMASKLGVTSSYLSAIEHGKKPIPDDLINKLANIYHLDETSIIVLQTAQNKSKKYVKISLDDCTDNQVYLINLFSNKIKNLDDFEIQQIRNILKGKLRS